MEEKFITTSEAMEVLSIKDPNTMCKYRSKKALPFYDFGDGDFRYRASEIISWSQAFRVPRQECKGHQPRSILSGMGLPSSTRRTVHA